MMPFTSRQWRNIGRWAMVACLWNILFGAWFSMGDRMGAWLMCILCLAACLALTLFAWSRESSIIRSLVCYQDERILALAIRDAWGCVWEVHQGDSWEDAAQELAGEYGRRAMSVDADFGYRTSRRSFVTPEEAAFICLYSKQARVQDGYGLEPSQVLWDAPQT